MRQGRLLNWNTVLTKNDVSQKSVVDIADARAKLRARQTRVGSASLSHELTAINDLLDKGLSVEARSRLSELISAARDDAELLASARLALSTAFEMHGDYRTSLHTVGMYETDESRKTLPADLAVRL